MHRDAVSHTVSNLAVSGVLGQRPPAIHPSEESLPRETRRTLSQLRSGYSRFLKTYLARLDSSVDPNCPDCNSHPTPQPPFRLLRKPHWPYPTWPLDCSLPSRRLPAAPHSIRPATHDDNTLPAKTTTTTVCKSGSLFYFAFLLTKILVSLAQVDERSLTSLAHVIVARWVLLPPSRDFLPWCGHEYPPGHKNSMRYLWFIKYTVARWCSTEPIWSKLKKKQLHTQTKHDITHYAAALCSWWQPKSTKKH